MLFEITSGLENLLDWDDLEELFLDDRFKSKYAVRVHVEELLGEKFTRRTYEQVIEGLWPDYREQYNGLPNQHPSDPVSKRDGAPRKPKSEKARVKLDAGRVREIRRRYAGGETLIELGREYGCKHNTLSNVVNRKSWKEVA